MHHTLNVILSSLVYPLTLYYFRIIQLYCFMQTCAINHVTLYVALNMNHLPYVFEHIDTLYIVEGMALCKSSVCKVGLLIIS